jgi:predicted DNA-binding transcriptional regulator YafY
MTKPVTWSLLSADTRRTITFTYTNYKGETDQRRVKPHNVSFEATEWHQEPQPLLEAYDLDRRAMRMFAMRDMKDVRYDE